MPSDMDRRVRCGRPEWTAAVGPDGVSTSRELDALQYASLAGSSARPTAAAAAAVAACRGYRNEHLLDDQGYLQRAERVPEHLISEGCTSENLVPAYNMALGGEVQSVRLTNNTSGVRAKPVSFIRGGSDGNALPRMAIQQDQIFIRRRPQQAVGVPRVVDASDLVDTGGRHCLMNKSMQRRKDNCPVQFSKGTNHLLAIERNTSGDRDHVTQRRHPISSAATFQLYGQPTAPLSNGGDGPASFGQTHHQQQYSIRHRFEPCQSAVQDRERDGYYGDVILSGGGRSPGDEGRSLSLAAENINRPVASDTGVDAGHRQTSGSSHTYRPIPVHIERDTTVPTSNLNARPYDAQSPVGIGNTNNTSSLQLRGTYDGRYQRARGVLSADPSEMRANRIFTPGHSGDTSRFHHYNEDCGIGGRSSVGIGSDGGGEYQATAPFTHIRRSVSETAHSSLASSYGSIRNVTRRPAPQHRQRLQTNQRPGFRFNDDANDVTAFNDGASTINVNESSSRFAASATTTTTASLSPPGHRSRKGFVAPSDLAIKGERITSPDFAALTLSSNRNSAASVLGSPHAQHVGLEMVDNHPSCRLQNFRMVQSISGDGFPTTPRSSGSTSTSSLTSPSRSASLLSAGDGGLFDQRADPEKMCRAGCPAPDCPGKGDCVPGATADTVAYEVSFKRGKMTFLLGDGLSDEGISCGDRVKVEADRGEDLGTVYRSLSLSEYLDALYEEKKAKAAKIAQNGGGGGGDGGGSEGKKKRNKAKKHNLAEDGDKHSTSKQHHHHQQKKQQQHEEVRDETCPVRTIKRILRPATEEELQQLEQKAQEEEQILHVCQTKVRNRGLPMKIVDAEYQFDRHKLTLFFEAERRVDFRELVRDLFAVYKTRIWMQQVKDKDKKSTSLSGNFAPDSDAPASAIGNCGNSSSDVSGLGNPFLNVPSSLLIDDAVTAHDADHDSGYGSAVSSDSGHPMVECLVSLAEGGDGSDTGGGGGSGSSALGFDSISDAFYNHNDSFKKSRSTPCAPSMSWLDEIENNESVGGSGGISFRSKRPFAAQYSVLLHGIDFSF